jgi:hypothetical protein
MHLYWIFAKAPGFGVMVITLAEFAIGFAYGALLEGFWNGQTIGKRLFHLRVIDQAGLPLRIEQAWVRNLMRVFDALPFAYLVGGISVLSSPLMQRFATEWRGHLLCAKRRWPCRGEESWTRQKYNSFMEYPTIAVHLRRAATPELASLIQDALE